MLLQWPEGSKAGEISARAEGAILGGGPRTWRACWWTRVCGLTVKIRPGSASQRAGVAKDCSALAARGLESGTISRTSLTATELSSAARLSRIAEAASGSIQSVTRKQWCGERWSMAQDTTLPSDHTHPPLGSDGRVRDPARRRQWSVPLNLVPLNLVPALPISTLTPSPSPGTGFVKCGFAGSSRSLSRPPFAVNLPSPMPTARAHFSSQTSPPTPSRPSSAVRSCVPRSAQGTPASR